MRFVAAETNLICFARFSLGGKKEELQEGRADGEAGEASPSVDRQMKFKRQSPVQKPNQICLLPSIRRIKASPVLAASCLGPRPEYYSVWLRCRVPVYQTLSSPVRAAASGDSLSQTFPEIHTSRVVTFHFGKAKKKKKE